MRRGRLSLAREEGSEELHINLTPLIDVVFVLLIMFIVIAPLLELDRIQLASSAGKAIKEASTVQEGKGSRSLLSVPLFASQGLSPGIGSCILQPNIIKPIFSCVLSASRTI